MRLRRSSLVVVSTGTVDHRRLPVYGADAFEVPFVIAGANEQITRNTHWDDHSHPTHELLWNERGASTATIGSRTWTVTPSVGLWIPAGVLHSGWMPAGTWYRAAQFSVVSVPSISADAVAVEISPLLRLLLERLLLSRHDSLERRITRLVLALRDREHGRER